MVKTYRHTTVVSLSNVLPFVHKKLVDSVTKRSKNMKEGREEEKEGGKGKGWGKWGEQHRRRGTGQPRLKLHSGHEFNRKSFDIWRRRSKTSAHFSGQNSHIFVPCDTDMHCAIPPIKSQKEQRV
jgi:hypothetical protein